MAPFRELLKKKQPFYWDEQLSNLFVESRKHIAQQVHEGVKLFEVGRTTALTTDYSKEGLGFFLQQKMCRCTTTTPHCGPDHWKLIIAGSRFTSDAEKRYSPVEGEALAVTYGLNSTKMYVLGNKHLHLGVDHRPLLAILGDQPLDKIENPRLLSFRLKCTPYSYKIFHIPGKDHVGPDVTSRYPVGHGDGETFLEEDFPENTNLKNSALISETVTMISHMRVTEEEELDGEEIDTDITESAIMALGTFETLRWEDLQDECIKDETCHKLAQAIKFGFPESREKCEDDIKNLYHFKDDLYLIDGVPMLNKRMFIPKALRPIVLETLHSACQGVASMKNASRLRFFWPGMDQAIVQVRAQCKRCNEGAPSQPKEEWVQDEAPTFPFESVCMDYFQIGSFYYLAQADRYSGWLQVNKTRSTAFSELSTILRETFMWTGVPCTISTDGGPPFNSWEFKEFCAKWKIKHRLASAGYPESNGRAELAVKAAKKMVTENTNQDGELNTDAMVRAILQYKNTRIRGVNESPAEILFGHALTDNLPRSPQDGWKRMNDGREIGMAKLKFDKMEHYNAKGKHNLEPLAVGEKVIIQNCTGPQPLKWQRTGLIVETCGNRQYLVKVDGSRRLILRNRKHLKQIAPFKLDGATSVRKPSYTEKEIPVNNQPQTRQPHPHTPRHEFWCLSS